MTNRECSDGSDKVLPGHAVGNAECQVWPWLLLRLLLVGSHAISPCRSGEGRHIIQVFQAHHRRIWRKVAKPRPSELSPTGSTAVSYRRLQPKTDTSDSRSRGMTRRCQYRESRSLQGIALVLNAPLHGHTTLEYLVSNTNNAAVTSMIIHSYDFLTSRI